MGSPVLRVKRERWSAWLIGELYGEHARDPERLIDELVAHPTEGSQLNGHFLILAWDSRSREWQVWTDRFGTLHAYTSGEGAALGTFFPAVAAATERRRLDWLGLAGFFSFGFFPRDRTHFEEVRILPPATHTVFTETGRLSRQERYWHWTHEPDTRRSYRDTVAEFGERFHGVLAEQTAEGPIALPISGGLDSRSTVAALPGNGDDGSRIWSFSYGYSDDSIETRIARRIAAARDLPFQAFRIGQYLADELERVLSCVEGFQDITQCRQAAVVTELARRGGSVIAAHWGDVWLDQAGFAAEPEAGISQILRRFEKRGRAWLLEHLCGPRLASKNPEGLLRDFLGEALGAYEQIADVDFRVKAFKTDHWSFRWTTTSLRMYQAGAFPRLPFYDTRIADFIATVPSDYVRDRRLQIDYLKQFAPDLARVTWQKHGTNLFRYAGNQTWLLPRRIVRKLWRTLTHQRVIERNWEVQFAGDAGRRMLEGWLVKPGRRLHEFVPPERLRRLLDGADRRPPDPGWGYAVSMLLTFSGWLELFGE